VPDRKPFLRVHGRSPEYPPGIKKYLSCPINAILQKEAPFQVFFDNFA